MNLQTCYSIYDLYLILTLFAATLIVIGTFILLMCHLINGVFAEVKQIKKNRVAINTR